MIILINLLLYRTNSWVTRDTTLLVVNEVFSGVIEKDRPAASAETGGSSCKTKRTEGPRERNCAGSKPFGFQTNLVPTSRNGVLHLSCGKTHVWQDRLQTEVFAVLRCIDGNLKRSCVNKRIYMALKILQRAKVTSKLVLECF